MAKQLNGQDLAWLREANLYLTQFQRIRDILWSKYKLTARDDVDLTDGRIIMGGNNANRTDRRPEQRPQARG